MALSVSREQLIAGGSVGLQQDCSFVSGVARDWCEAAGDAKVAESSFSPLYAACCMVPVKEW